MITDEQIQIFVDTAHSAVMFELLKCSSGNLSMRLSDKHLAMSASGSWLGTLQPEQVAVCEIETNKSVNGVRPTIESGFHVGILRNRREINFVLHYQSPYATVLACSNPEDYAEKLHNTIEMPSYIGDPAIVDYALPGSDQLSELVIVAYKNKETNIAILKNHGQVAVGTTSADTIQKAVFFEMNCMIALTSPNLKSLNIDQRKGLSDLGKA